MKKSKPSSSENLRDSLSVILAIASKDIVDALKNKVVISLTLMLSVMLLLPKMLPLIFEQPKLVLLVYDLGDSDLVGELKNDPDISLLNLPSEQEFQTALCAAAYPQLGLRIPADFDQGTGDGGQLEFQGYVCWSKRHQVSDLQPIVEEQLSKSLGRPATLQTDGNIVFPPSDGVLSLNIATLNAVVLVLMMGISLVPSLLFEEKETRTLQALLVSPASISQVVIGKALAGAFYILVTALLLFSITWVDVIHWEMAVLFVLAGGFFSVAVGLVMGSFFEKQQDTIGWTTVLLVLMIGAIMVKLLGLELPPLLESILPWLPPVALAEVCAAVFSESVVSSQVMGSLGITLGISLILYALVIWKIRHSDS